MFAYVRLRGFVLFRRKARRGFSRVANLFEGRALSTSRQKIGFRPIASKLLNPLAWLREYRLFLQSRSQHFVSVIASAPPHHQQEERLKTV